MTLPGGMGGRGSSPLGVSLLLLRPRLRCTLRSQITPPRCNCCSGPTRQLAHLRCASLHCLWPRARAWGRALNAAGTAVAGHHWALELRTWQPCRAGAGAWRDGAAAGEGGRREARRLSSWLSKAGGYAAPSPTASRARTALTVSAEAVPPESESEPPLPPPPEVGCRVVHVKRSASPYNLGTRKRWG